MNVLRLKKKIYYADAKYISLKLDWFWKIEIYNFVMMPSSKEYSNIKKNQSIQNSDWVCNFINAENGIRLTETQLIPAPHPKRTITTYINALLRSLDSNIKDRSINPTTSKLYFRKSNIICKLNKIDKSELEIIRLSTKQKRNVLRYKK